MNFVRKKAGFTLAELLIVVAIIAVLAALSIPVFASKLEASRESVDWSNLRSAYAIGKMAQLEGGADEGWYDPDSDSLVSKSVALGEQKTAGIQGQNQPKLPSGIILPSGKTAGLGIYVFAPAEGKITVGFAKRKPASATDNGAWA